MLDTGTVKSSTVLNLLSDCHAHIHTLEQKLCNV